MKTFSKFYLTLAVGLLLGSSQFALADDLPFRLQEVKQSILQEVLDEGQTILDAVELERTALYKRLLPGALNETHGRRADALRIVELNKVADETRLLMGGADQRVQRFLNSVAADVLPLDEWHLKIKMQERGKIVAKLIRELTLKEALGNSNDDGAGIPELKERLIKEYAKASIQAALGTPNSEEMLEVKQNMTQVRQQIERTDKFADRQLPSLFLTYRSSGGVFRAGSFTATHIASFVAAMVSSMFFSAAIHPLSPLAFAASLLPVMTLPDYFTARMVKKVDRLNQKTGQLSERLVQVTYEAQERLPWEAWIEFEQVLVAELGIDDAELSNVLSHYLGGAPAQTLSGRKAMACKFLLTAGGK